MLKNLGETPVNTLTGSIPTEASQAQAVLSDIQLEVLKKGWFFNTEYFSLAPDVNGFIYLPANTLQVRTEGADRRTPVSQRGNRLYNMTPFEHGFVWTGNVKVRLVLGITFEDLPQTARSYIALRAARVFQIQELGDEINSRDDITDESTALSELIQEQNRMAPFSLKDSNSVKSALSQIPVENYYYQ